MSTSRPLLAFAFSARANLVLRRNYAFAQFIVSFIQIPIHLFIQPPAIKCMNVCVWDSVSAYVATLSEALFASALLLSC